MIDKLADNFPSYPKNGVYLDNLTLGLQHRLTIDALYHYNLSNGTSVRKALHKYSRSATELYYEAKKSYAKYFGASEENYAWIPNSDYGWNLVLYSLIQSSKHKLRFISSIFDHHSLLAPLVHLNKQGVIDLQLLGIQEEYNLAESILNLADNNTIIVLGHISPLIGLYRDIDSITQVAHTIGAKVAIDYSRSAAQSLVRLDNPAVDIAIIDGPNDLMGPIGAGILYINSDFLPNLQNPFPSSGNVRYVIPNDLGQIRNIERFETGNPNIGAMTALATSMEYILAYGREKMVLQRIELMNYLIKHLAKYPQISLIDPLLDTKMGNPQRASVICYNVNGLSSHDVALLLEEEDNVMVRSGRICTHPGIFSLELEEVVQVSVHHYNTREDVDRLIHGIQRLLEIQVTSS